MKSLLKRLLGAIGVPTYVVAQNYRELQAAFIRVWSATPWQRAKVRRMMRTGAVRLNFGCGLTRYEGWYGVDQFYGPTVDLAIDLRGRVPFPDNSVDYAYSEHFLEHLFPEEGLKHLQEVHRVLRPGGRYRVVVPDVLKFADRYLKGDDDFFRRAFPWEERPIQALYAVANFRGDHRAIYDHKELEHFARQAGFSAALPSEANASEIAELRIDKPDPQRIEESLYMDLVK